MTPPHQHMVRKHTLANIQFSVFIQPQVKVLCRTVEVVFHHASGFIYRLTKIPLNPATRTRRVSET